MKSYTLLLEIEEDRLAALLDLDAEELEGALDDNAEFGSELMLEILGCIRDNGDAKALTLSREVPL